MSYILRLGMRLVVIRPRGVLRNFTVQRGFVVLTFFVSVQ